MILCQGPGWTLLSSSLLQKKQSFKVKESSKAHEARKSWFPHPDYKEASSFGIRYVFKAHVQGADQRPIIVHGSSIDGPSRAQERHQPLGNVAAE